MILKNTRHIYWFAYFGNQEPSVRYRAKYPLEILKNQFGIDYDLVQPSYNPLKILKFLFIFFEVLLFRRKNSVVVFEKIRTRRLYANALKVLLYFRKENTVYDIDDADYLKFPPKTIYHFMMHCEKCTVGSNSLAQVANLYNSRVSLLTSPVIGHGFKKAKRNVVLQIGWIGYYSAHRQSLIALLFPALLALDFPFELVLLGVKRKEHFQEINDYFASCPFVKLTIPSDLDWQNEEDIYRRISMFDIGVAPLLKTPVNEAKSAFKLKQYMSCGVPVLGSNVGENCVFLKHEVNGFVCNTSDDFRESIIHIAGKNDIDYAQLSGNALETTLQFNMHHYCNTFLEILEA